MRYVLIVFVLLPNLLLAQSGRQHTPLYDLDHTRFLNKGWHFAPGVTYMWPSSSATLDTRLYKSDLITDTLYSGIFDQKGRIGLHLEVGRHHLMDFYYLLDNIDYGLGFKLLRGSEEFEGFVKQDSVKYDVMNTATFSEGFVTGFVNFGNIYQLSDKFFLHNSLGFNADYRVISNRTTEGNFAGMIHEFPPNFIGQMHYRLGFGIKMQARVFVVPSVETPILTLVKFDDGKSTLSYFSSRYRPLIFTLRFMFLDRRPSQDCVGKSSGTTGHTLWDKSMTRKRRKRH